MSYRSDDTRKVHALEVGLAMCEIALQNNDGVAQYLLPC